MKTNVAYEIVDFRPGAPLAGIGGLQLTPGGDLRVDLTDGVGETLSINLDAADAFHDDEDAGTVLVMTPAGRIHMQALSREHLSYLKERAFIDSRLPTFASEADLQSYFLEQVALNAHG